MTFENQFKNKIKIETLGGFVEIIDIHPTNMSLYPVFISSGWASTPELLKPLLKSISNNGKRVITIDFQNLDNIKYNKKFKKRADFKAQAILDTLDKLKIEKIDIIGHSEGAVNTVLAISMDPIKFRNFLLVAPAGMIHNQSFLSLAFRFLLNILLWPIQKIKGINRPVYHILQNIKFCILNPIQSMSEGYGLSKIYIGEKVKEVAEKGVSVNLIYFEKDIMFPQKLVKKNAEKNNIPFNIISGAHNYIYSKPEIFWSKINKFLN